MEPSPGKKKRLTKTRSTFWAHSKADLALSRDTTPLWFPVPLLIPHSGHHSEHAVMLTWEEMQFWACCHVDVRRNANCRAHTSPKHSLKANAIQFTSWLCGTAGSLCAQTERQQLQLGRIWDLDVCTRPYLSPWKANLVLLFCYIHRCLEHSLEVQAFVFNSLSGHLQSLCFTQHCLAPLLCPSSVLITAPSINVT